MRKLGEIAQKCDFGQFPLMFELTTVYCYSTRKYLREVAEKICAQAKIFGETHLTIYSFWDIIYSVEIMSEKG